LSEIEANQDAWRSEHAGPPPQREIDTVRKSRAGRSRPCRRRTRIHAPKPGAATRRVKRRGRRSVREASWCGGVQRNSGSGSCQAGGQVGCLNGRAPIGYDDFGHRPVAITNLPDKNAEAAAPVDRAPQHLCIGMTGDRINARATLVKVIGEQSRAGRGWCTGQTIHDRNRDVRSSDAGTARGQ